MSTSVTTWSVCAWWRSRKKICGRLRRRAGHGSYGRGTETETDSVPGSENWPQHLRGSWRAEKVGRQGPKGPGRVWSSLRGRGMQAGSEVECDLTDYRFIAVGWKLCDKWIGERQNVFSSRGFFY